MLVVIRTDTKPRSGGHSEKGSMSGTISDISGHILTSEMSGAEGRLEVQIFAGH